MDFFSLPILTSSLRTTITIKVRFAWYETFVAYIIFMQSHLKPSNLSPSSALTTANTFAGTKSEKKKRVVCCWSIQPFYSDPLERSCHYCHWSPQYSERDPSDFHPGNADRERCIPRFPLARAAKSSQRLTFSWIVLCNKSHLGEAPIVVEGHFRHIHLCHFTFALHVYDLTFFLSQGQVRKVAVGWIFWERAKRPGD